jgi:hypothetical protein
MPRMKTNELLQRVVYEALTNGDYTIDEIRTNVEAAIESYEQAREYDEDDNAPVEDS